MQWQQNACTTLRMTFKRQNSVSPGSPTHPLTPPSSSKTIIGDGNCLFRSFAYIICGNQNSHMLVRTAICQYMRTIGSFLLQLHIDSRYTTIEQYITQTRMNKSETWGTDIEIFTLAHLLDTPIMVYHHGLHYWNRYAPNAIDPTRTNDVTRTAVYINFRPNREHFDVVLEVAL